MKKYGLPLVFFALLAMALLEVRPQEKGATVHPVWVDARDGAFQVYTARIEVRKGI